MAHQVNRLVQSLPWTASCSDSIIPASMHMDPSRSWRLHATSTRAASSTPRPVILQPAKFDVNLSPGPRSGHSQFGRAGVEIYPLPGDPPLGRDWEQFDVLWYRLARELQVGKRAASAVSSLVRKGQLPCDATLLHDRAKAFLEMQLPPRSQSLLAGAGSGSFLPRLVLSEQAGQVLRYPHIPLSRTLRRLAALLPEVDPSLAIGTLMGDVHRMAPELLALKFLELNWIFRAVFGTDIPQQTFSYLTAGDEEQRLRSRMRQQQLVQQQLWGQGGQGKQLVWPLPSATAIGAPEADSAGIRPLQLQERLSSMSATLGREVAFVVLRSHPQLLDLPAGLVASRCAALADLLSLNRNQGQLLPVVNSHPRRDDEPGTGTEAPKAGDRRFPSAHGMDGMDSMDVVWQVVERRGDILLLPSEQLRVNLEALVEGLRWRGGRTEVLELVVSEPLALLSDWREVVSRAGRLEMAVSLGVAVQRREHWKKELEASRVELVALALRRSSEVLERIDYLLHSTGAPQRWDASLARILSEAKADFLRLSPGYSRWRAGGAGSEELPLEQQLRWAQEAAAVMGAPKRPPGVSSAWAFGAKEGFQADRQATSANKRDFIAPRPLRPEGSVAHASSSSPGYGGSGRSFESASGAAPAFQEMGVARSAETASPRETNVKSDGDGGASELRSRGDGDSKLRQVSLRSDGERGLMSVEEPRPDDRGPGVLTTGTQASPLRGAQPVQGSGRGAESGGQERQVSTAQLPARGAGEWSQPTRSPVGNQAGVAPARRMTRAERKSADAVQSAERAAQSAALHTAALLLGQSVDFDDPGMVVLGDGYEV